MKAEIITRVINFLVFILVLLLFKYGDKIGIGTWYQITIAIIYVLIFIPSNKNLKDFKEGKLSLKEFLIKFIPFFSFFSKGK